MCTLLELDSQIVKYLLDVEPLDDRTISLTLNGTKLDPGVFNEWLKQNGVSNGNIKLAVFCLCTFFTVNQP